MRRSSSLSVIFRLFVVLELCAGFSHGSILIDGFTPERHDRFANDAAFLGASFDWSGVGRSSSGQWATMISDRYFLSAAHSHPGGTITFYPDNDPAGIPVTETVASGTRIGTTDLWLSMLANPLPPSITSYAVPGLPIADSAGFLSSGYFLETIYNVGISATTTDYGASNVTNMAVGRNLLDLFFDELDVIAGTVTDAIGYIRDPPISPDYPDRFIEDESYLRSGDSGGPSFLADDNGGLLLVGIHWFNGTLEDENEMPLAQVSGDSFVSNYIGEINAAMSTGSIVESGFITTVPEPSELSAIGVMVGFLVMGSRWRRQERAKGAQPRATRL